MTPFTTLTSRAVALPEANIDTDIILPARYLLLTERAGLGRYAFADRRGTAGFSLGSNGEAILVAGDNFGCGSSREQAAWALADLGFRWRCVLAEAGAGRALTVDLKAQAIRLADGATIGFAIDPAAREALLGGWDEIGLVLTKDSDAIAAFEAAQRAAQPWLWDRETADG